MEEYVPPRVFKWRPSEGSCNFCDRKDAAVTIHAERNGGVWVRFCDNCVRFLYRAWVEIV